MALVSVYDSSLQNKKLTHYWFLQSLNVRAV